MTPLLEARGLVRTFASDQGPVWALDGVSFRLDQQSLGIVGESGSGKSTLINLVLGLDRPDHGEVLFQGRRLTRPQDWREFRRHVQVVFQDPKGSLNPRMTVRDIVAEPLRSLRVPGNHHRRVTEILEAVGLDPDRADDHPSQFSGGQRQRIAIARALAPAPRVLIGDEPVSALDVTTRLQILALLAQLTRDFGLTLVLVSHDLAVVSSLCPEVLVLQGGKVQEQGLTREVFASPRSPYTRTLLSAVPRLRSTSAP